MNYFFAFLLILFVAQSGAQTGLSRNLTPEVTDPSGILLKYPWVGGFNSVHLCEIDLNLDGINDLFVYDLAGGRISTFLNGGTAGTIDYTYAPEYQNKFPKAISAFVRLIDYNNDGKNDLFTHFGPGIKVYKNVSNTTDGLKFEDVTNHPDHPYLRSRYIEGPNGISNLYVARGDIPAIVDLDNDGDLDILAFGNTAATVYYHQNMAADSGNLEEFDFHMATSCWGNFEEDFNSALITLDISCKGGGIPPGKRNKHAGSTMLAFDMDGDHDKDLLIGDISYNHLNFLTNGGDSLYANMVGQELQFPPGTTPIDLTTFPAAHYLDVNNDGKKDLMITPNTTGSVENANSIWLYLNTGNDKSPAFQLETTNFLQSEMIELGAGAFPTFLDYNGDSIPDLVVGNHGFYNGVELPLSRLTLYQTTASYDYRVVDTNLANLSNLSLNLNLNLPTQSLIPAFGDLDNDGDQDLIVGDFQGKIHYFRNVAASGATPDFELAEAEYGGIDVGGYAAPQLFDLNRDGRLDLIIGRANGKLSYFQNTGTKQVPAFEKLTDELGGVNVVPPFEYNGFSYPFFFLSGESLNLLCGSQSGRIYHYDDIESNLNGSFHVIDTAFGGIREGIRSTVAGDDIDHDGKLDLVIGNYAGGVSLYKSELPYSKNFPTNTTDNDRIKFDFVILPVPSDGRITIQSEIKNFSAERYDVDIFNVQGSKFYSKKNTDQKTFDLRYLSKGIYYLRLQNGNEQAIKKFITL